MSFRTGTNSSVWWSDDDFVSVRVGTVDTGLELELEWSTSESTHFLLVFVSRPNVLFSH